MDISLSTWMMIAFIVFTILGMWKIYAFLPNKQLADDDTTYDSYLELEEIMLDVLKLCKEAPDLLTLHKMMCAHEQFDQEHFWRFNPNKLNQLLNKYFILNPHITSLKAIHQEVRN